MCQLPASHGAFIELIVRSVLKVCQHRIFLLACRCTGSQLLATYLGVPVEGVYQLTGENVYILIIITELREYIELLLYIQ